MLSLLLTAVVVSPAFAQDPLVLYVPFDGTCEAALAAPGVKVSSAGEVGFAEGMLGQGAVITADCRYAVGDAFPVSGGTFAAWIKPSWPGNDATGRTLMCIYGPPDQPDAWMRNLWSITAGGGAVHFFIFPKEGGKSTDIAASIADWQPDSWHHVAATWAWIGSAGKAQMRLYLDGTLAAEATDLTIDAGQPGPVLDIGRDSDASPDYAEAVYDEVFLYARPLTAEEIATAVDRVRAGDLPKPAPPAAAPRQAPGWAFPELPYRAIIDTTPQERARKDAWFEAPLGLTSDLGQLGLPGAADPGSLRLVEVGDSRVARGEPLPLSLQGDRAVFRAPGQTPAGASRHFALYFGVLSYQPVASLLVATSESKPTAGDLTTALPNDYATATYGDAWDFDEGDTEAIDRFGDKPEYFRDVRVEDGVLKASVSQDPYFIWGSMWGPEDKGQRRVRIDVDEYNVLEMRVKQSVPSARWVLYGRVAGSDQLQVYRFPVAGTGWQVIRINLVDDAHWGGVLSAFRIDPTEEVNADIEIDWVRLVSLRPAHCQAVELLGSPSGEAGSIAATVPTHEATAGQEQTLTVVVKTAAGQPVAGQPVRVWLAADSGGQLAPQAQPALPTGDGGFRALTGADGRVLLTYSASRKAQKRADTILASTEFPTLAAEELTVDTKPGPAHHYRVLSDSVTILREQDAPFTIPAQPVDQFANPTEGPAPTAWQVADGRLDWSEAGRQGQPARASLYPDMSRRWVYTVIASSPGLQGASGPICVLPKGPRPNPVSLGENGYFKTADGLPYLPLGGFYINWVGLPDPNTGEQGRVIRSFTDVDEAATRDWLSYLHSQGVTTLRFMLRTHTKDGLEPMDIGGRANLPLFARALRLMDLARPYGLRFLLVIHDDYDKPVYCNARNLEQFSLPRFAGEDLDALPPYQRRFIRDRRVLRLASEKYTDPDAMRCQDDYARELIGYLKDNPQVFGYELENEMVNCPREWAEHAIETIRAVDPNTPICVSHGGGGLQTADPLWWTTQTPIDFYTYHLYPIGSTDDATDYGAGVLRLAKYGAMAGTCFLGESSGDEFSQYPPERDADRKYIMRDIIWMSLIAGNPGCFFWNARGYEVEQFKLAHQVMAEIDWTRWKRARPDIAILVDHPYNDDKYFRSPQGVADRAMMGRYCQHFLSEGVDFDFVMQAGGYAKTAGLAEFAPPEPAKRPFRVSPGFQLASLTREGGREGLLYVRNFAGIREWSVPKRGSMWLRDRKAAPLSVTFDLPAGDLALRWWDLDTGESKEISLNADGTVDLGHTDRDFAIHWRAL
jgi:hypothetical protein